MKREVENHPGLVKDMRSGAVLNTSKSDIEAARMRKKKRIQNQERLDQLEHDISEIKFLIKEIIGRL